MLRSKSLFRSLLSQLLLLCGGLILAACANQGAGPDGGPYDEDPPRLVGMTAPTKVAGGRRMKFRLSFNELIKVDNPQERVVVSPPQIETPEITVSGRHLTVQLLDSIRPNTTYTVDFSDAITDANENNPLGQYTYVFSTGSVPDSMEISGRVLSADELEPLKGLLVGLHEATADSAFTTRSFERVARTDGNGRFTIKGVSASRSYRIFALQDADGDFKFSAPSELIAFHPEAITPSSFADTRRDTLWTDSLHYDSIRIVPFTHYLPDDLVLLAFKEAHQPRALLKTQRDVPERFTAYFTAPSAHRPRLRGLNFEAEGAFLTQANANNDTITYWIVRPELIEQDSLRLSYEYEAWHDSLRHNYFRTDTLELLPRLSFAKRAKQQAEQLQQFEKERARRHKRGDFSKELPPPVWLETKVAPTGTFSPLRSLTLSFEAPLRELRRNGLHLQLKRDSTYHDVPFALDTLPNLLERSLRAEWRPGQQYRLLLDSACFESIYGRVNAAAQFDLSIAKAEDYGTLFLHLTGGTEHSIVQLLDGNGKVIAQQRALDGQAAFYYLSVGNYYLRCFDDANADGRWSPGQWSSRLEPEPMRYLPRPVLIRANWDANEEWDLRATPLDAQKPEKLIKQKEKKAANNVRQRNLDRLRERNSSR